jgi:hypothetical protein
MHAMRGKTGARSDTWWPLPAGAPPLTPGAALVHPTGRGTLASNGQGRAAGAVRRRIHPSLREVAMEPRGEKRGWWSAWRAAAQEEPLSERLLEAQLARVRRELRLHRAALAVLALAAVGLGWLELQSHSAQQKDVLRAHRIEVLSQEGRPVVVLDADRVGGHIALRYNRPGDPPPPALFLSAEPNGGSVQLFEPGQNFYALGLEVAEAGHGVLQLRARGMQPGLELRGPQQRGGELELFNARGRPALRLGSDAGGRGVISTLGGAP